MTETITNIAKTAGTFDSLPTSLTSQAVVTQLTTDLTITKTADKQVWADGVLTYQVVIKNDNDTLAYETVILTDIIDPTKATLVPNSVMINGTATTDFTFDNTTGTLTVNVGTIATEGSGTVTFQIRKV